MFSIKGEFNGYNAKDLYNFIAAVTSDNAVQIKITKAYVDGNFGYTAEVRYPDYRDRFIWDHDRVDGLNLTGVKAAEQAIKALTETGTIILWTDTDSAKRDDNDRYFTLEYFKKGTEVMIDVEIY